MPVDGKVGVAVAAQGRPLTVPDFTIREDKVLNIEAISDPTRLEARELAVLG